ncbi:hypothetical protein [Sphingomonas sanguinis]|uniref:hypothetical protein n=1 Tax=Sphingomonas sanguinis TaxID=33051 RepID=UPI00077BAC24|nr:hypothetical protein [Sphingomonas sanguinis]
MTALFMPRCSDAISDASAKILLADALRDIIAERIEQIDKHGYTPESDERYETPDELIGAATCYADTAHDQVDGSLGYDPHECPAEWPWSPTHWHCRDARRNLVKAAALIWAAIDNIDRAEQQKAVADTRPLASGTEPPALFRPIEAADFPAGSADTRSWLVRDDKGNCAAACWIGDKWVYATEDAPCQQLEFHPTLFLPDRAARPGFVDFPIA